MTEREEAPWQCGEDASVTTRSVSIGRRPLEFGRAEEKLGASEFKRSWSAKKLVRDSIRRWHLEIWHADKKLRSGSVRRERIERRSANTLHEPRKSGGRPLASIKKTLKHPNRPTRETNCIPPSPANGDVSNSSFSTKKTKRQANLVTVARKKKPPRREAKISRLPKRKIRWKHERRWGTYYTYNAERCVGRRD